MVGISWESQCLLEMRSISSHAGCSFAGSGVAYLFVRNGEEDVMVVGHWKGGWFRILQI